MNKQLLADFASPASAYRGKPFWAWNGRLEPDELRRQVRVLHQMGLGGFFMHSRVGLSTPYLGEEWFACVKACIDEAKKLGMEAWLYDEDRWPSGAAGGLVTRNSKHRMRHLKLEVVNDPAKFKWAADVLAAFAARLDGPVARNVRRLSKATLRQDRAVLEPGDAILAFRVVVDPLSPWYNGYTYLDTLSDAAVAQFIKVTHEAYRRRCGRAFGKVVPGIFTDEPNYGGSDGAIRAWTPKLPTVFRERYGYDLLDHLVELYYDLEGQELSKARYHYFDCVTHLFVTAFSRQIGQWCGKHRLLYTGHMLSEDTLSHQMRVVGSCMRHYEFMQAPGMDLLTEHWRAYVTAKQVSSVARQFGWKWRLTETNGCTGWDFPFEAHKALGDWQAACGINLRCPHLSWYTMLGEAKRDYPASIFYQSPWWEQYAKIEDYFGRITAVMTRGAEVRDLLVIHPVESAWTLGRLDWGKDDAVNQYDQQFNDLTNALLSAQIDFDYGDEEMLSRHAKVAKGKDGAAPTFKVAKATYQAVLVPPLRTMRGSTLALLEKFAAAGGTVVFAGAAPRYVDADPSDAAVQFAGSCPKVSPTGADLIAAVGPTCRRISITDAAGTALAPVIYLLREDRESFYLFMVNTGCVPGKWADDPLARDRGAVFADVRIRGFADCAGAPVELCPASGCIYTTDSARPGGVWEIRTSLPRLGTRLYVIPKAATAIAATARPNRREVKAEPLGGGAWDITLSEPNVLVLDRPRYQIGQGDWQGPMEILRVDRAVREALKVPPRGGQMVQPWARPKVAKPKRALVTLAYLLDVGALPSGELALALEEPRRFQITLNAQPLSTDADAGWWTDKSLRKVPIDPALLRLGANRLTLECDFDETFSGLEIMYLLGHFGTAVNDTEVALTAPPATLQLGDWVSQGLAFYGGSVAYRRRIAPALAPGQRLVVKLGAYRGVAVRVLVDGRSAGVIGWEPSELDITDLVPATGAELALEVLGHRRNSHGPLHHSQQWPQWTGPGEFITKDDKWIEGYQLVPCGLMSEPQLVVRE